MIEKLIKVSVKQFHNKRNLYFPNIKTYDSVEIIDLFNNNDIDFLVDTMALDVHSYYVYDNNNRNEKSFREAYAIVLDFDNKGHHDNSSIDEFINSSFANKFNWFLYTSKSHVIGANADCFHVAIFFETPITNVELLKKTNKFIFNEIKKDGLVCDYQVSDAARLILPSRKNGTYECDDIELYSNFKGEFFSLEKNIDEINNINLKIVTTKNKNNVNLYTHDIIRRDEDYDESVYFKEFKMMPSIEKFVYFRSIVTFINQQNSKSRFNMLTRRDWINIGLGIDNEFDFSEGSSLFSMLSSGHPNDDYDDIIYQYDNIHSNNRKILNADTVIKISARLGFDHNMYFVYYYKRLHKFTTTKRLKLFNSIVKRLYNDVYEDSYKLYRYTSKGREKSYLLVVNKHSNVEYRKVSLTHLMDVASNVLGTPRQFITSSITKDVIQKFISINGVFDFESYIIDKFTSLKTYDGNYKMSDVIGIVNDIKSFTPKSVSVNYTVAKVVNFLFEKGIVIKKTRKRVMDGDTIVHATVFIVADDVVNKYESVVDVHEPEIDSDNSSVYTSIVDVIYYSDYCINNEIFKNNSELEWFLCRQFLIKKILDLCN